MKKDLDARQEQRRLERRGLSARTADARRAHKQGGARAGIHAYCAGNKWLIENAKGAGNW